MAEHPQPHKRKRLSARRSWDKEVEAGLSAIYGDDLEDVPIVTRTPRSLRAILSKVLGVLAVLLVIVLGAALWLSRDFLGRGKAPLELTIEAPQEVQSGALTRIEVRYRNDDRRPLGNLDIDLSLPLGFILESTMPAPTDEESLVWKFGSLGGSSDGVIVLTGRVWGEPGNVASVQAMANYRPSSFNSDFSAIASDQLSITKSILSGSWEGPAEVRPGERVTYRLTVQNGGDTVITGAALDVVLPVALKIVTATPAFESEGSTKIPLPELAPGGSAIVELVGAFAADEATSLPVQASILVPNPKDPTQSLRVWQGETVTKLLASDLMISLVGNGSATNAEVAPGKALRLSVKVENRSGNAVRSPQLILDVQPEKGVPIVWKDTQLDGGRITAQGIVFSGNSFPDLASKGEKGWAVSLPITSSLAADSADRFTITPRLKYGTSTIEGVPLTVIIAGDVRATAAYRYFAADGKAIGEGAWPPKEGQTTTIDATMTITPVVHGLKEIDILIPLENNVVLGDVLDAAGGQLTMNTSDRSLRYRNDVGTSETRPLQIRYTLRVTPDASNVGGYMRLVKAATVRARDIVTSGLLTTSLPAVTTELPDDAAAAGTGAVTD